MNVKKYLLPLVLSIFSVLLLFGCSSGAVKDFTGTWESKEVNGGYIKADITSNEISLTAIKKDSGEKFAIWNGTYQAPNKEVTEYSWTSQATKNASLIDSVFGQNNNASLTFTYKDGVLSTTINNEILELRKQK